MQLADAELTLPHDAASLSLSNIQQVDERIAKRRSRFLTLRLQKSGRTSDWPANFFPFFLLLPSFEGDLSGTGAPHVFNRLRLWPDPQQ